MEGGIKISLDEVSATAQTIRTLNTKMNTLLEEAKGEIDKLSASWQSEGGEAIREKISKRAATFEEYRKIIDSYATFLDDTVNTYSTTENTIKANADAFQ